MDIQTARDNNRTSRYGLVSAALAFVLWGGWAYYVNRGGSVGTGVMSGLTQGLASFTITLLMVRAIQWLQGFFSRRLYQIALPPLLTVAFTGSCLLMLHLLAGTPNIAMTILPALSVAYLFCLVTAIRLISKNTLKETEYEGFED
jgi:hypothetical protein